MMAIFFSRPLTLMINSFDMFPQKSPATAQAKVDDGVRCGSRALARGRAGSRLLIAQLNVKPWRG
jgi:hypothetical protein